MSSLTIQQNRHASLAGKAGDTLELKLSGAVDESVDYSVVQTAGVGRIIFDFEGVRLVNSTGLQHWIKFLTGLPAATVVDFVRCSIRVITQINMFPGFLGNRPVTIGSFYAPYFCEACDKSCDILLETGRDFSDLKNPTAPKRQCPTCKAPVEFDGIEKKFFLFLKP